LSPHTFTGFANKNEGIVPSTIIEEINLTKKPTLIHDIFQVPIQDILWPNTLGSPMAIISICNRKLGLCPFNSSKFLKPGVNTNISNFYAKTLWAIQEQTKNTLISSEMQAQSKIKYAGVREEKFHKYFVFVEVLSLLFDIVGGDVYFADYTLFSSRTFLDEIQKLRTWNKTQIDPNLIANYSMDQTDEGDIIGTRKFEVENRRVVAIGFNTNNGETLFATLVFVVKDIHLHSNVTYKGCTILTEMYLSFKPVCGNTLPKKIIDILIMASICTNTHLIFWMPFEDYIVGPLSDTVNEISQRLLTKISNKYNRPIYMVGLSRQYIGLVFDRIYTQDILGLFQLTDTGDNVFIPLSEKILAVASCYTKRHAINKDDTITKQFIYAASLLHVFAEDPDIVVAPDKGLFTKFFTEMKTCTDIKKFTEKLASIRNRMCTLTKEIKFDPKHAK
jgi:hypothetical protein